MIATGSRVVDRSGREGTVVAVFAWNKGRPSQCYTCAVRFADTRRIGERGMRSLRVCEEQAGGCDATD